MALPLLTTKLYIPSLRPELASRPRLIERLEAGLDRKLTLISAPAGSGKTTLLTECAARCGRPVAWLSLIEPLTRREIEVLQLICEGYSNRQIAERLVVTMNTVKKHTSHIYGKLGVKSRTQAVARARELHL